MQMSHDHKMATEAAKRPNFDVFGRKETHMDYEATVEEARDCLLIRDFRHCYKLCQTGISRAKVNVEEHR